MKKLLLANRVFAIAVSAASFLLFFTGFITARYAGAEPTVFTGFGMAFGQAVNTVVDGAAATVGSAKSFWYMTAFIFAAFNLLFNSLAFKKSKMKWAALVTSAASVVNLTVISLSGMMMYADLRASKAPVIHPESAKFEYMLMYVFILSFVALAISICLVFVDDYVTVSKSKGAKKLIWSRLRQFFKDYKSEIKKIVWPGKSTVIRNFIIVVVMCFVVGAFIWIIDYGLSELMKLLYKKTDEGFVSGIFNNFLI